jgi:hypothetical protein
MTSTTDQNLGKQSDGPLPFPPRGSSGSSDRPSRSEGTADPSPTPSDAEKQIPTTISDPFPHQDLEKGIVGWDGPDDPENPRFAGTSIIHENTY